MKKSVAITREGVRKVLFWVFGTVVAFGMALLAFAPARSALAELGAVLVWLFWIPVGWAFSWFIFGTRGTKWARRVPTPQSLFAQGTPVPELAVTMRLLPEALRGKQVTMRPGPHTFALVIGTDGFTVRFVLPEGVTIDTGSAQRVEVQFLNPTLALPQFEPGTDFRMVTRNGVIGEGKVIEALPRAG